MGGNVRRSRTKEAGFVVTAEVLLITVVLGIGLLTGLTKLRDQTLAELSDTGQAIGRINQSYAVRGTQFEDGGADAAATVASVSGFGFTDALDPVAAAPAAVGGDDDVLGYLAAAAQDEVGIEDF